VDYVRLIPDGLLPEVSVYAPFKAVVVIEATYSPEWQDEVSRWLVDSGCRYMMAWGDNCSSWDDSVDHAEILKHLPGDVPDNQFVMTTWHKDETLENVFWYAQFCAQFSYDDVALTNALIIHISETVREAEMRALFEQSKTLAEREPEEG
ncbi:MAG TPA: hypothetical protein VFU20_02480, partial [Sphingomicrobium sp.]|nr:hypothetical protein [Sphingomicrobium sp.]